MFQTESSVALRAQPAAELARLCASSPLVFAPVSPQDDGVADPTRASARLAQIYSPHHMRVFDPADGFNMRLRTRGVGSITLSMLSFNAEVELQQRASASFSDVGGVAMGPVRRRIAGNTPAVAIRRPLRIRTIE